MLRQLRWKLIDEEEVLIDLHVKLSEYQRATSDSTLDTFITMTLLVANERHKADTYVQIHVQKVLLLFQLETIHSVNHAIIHILNCFKYTRGRTHLYCNYKAAQSI